MLKLKRNPLFTFGVYDDTPPPAPPPAPPPPAPPPANKTYTQVELEQQIAEVRKKDEDRVKKVSEELRKMQESSQLTVKEKADLETRIKELQEQYMTKEQIAAQEAEKERLKSKTEYESVTGERDRWKNTFEQSAIENAIIRSTASDAVHADQIRDLLVPKSRVVEEKDADGKGTGDFKVMVKITITDKKTKLPVVLDLPIDDAVKQMKENVDRYGNLFKSTMQGGLGGSNGKVLKDSEIKDMTNEEYKTWRESKGLTRK